MRYVDDFAVFSDDWDFLVAARQAIESYLAGIRLTIHPIKSQLFETQYGATFLGFRVLPIGETLPKKVRIRVRTENLRRGRRRLRRLQSAYIRGEIEKQAVSQSLQSWLAHLKHGNTWHLRQKIVATLVFSKE